MRARRTKLILLALTVPLTIIGAVQFNHSPVSPHETLVLHRVNRNADTNKPMDGNSVLRIGTFNIHGGKGRNGRRDLTKTASCLEDLDIVGLNEVRSDWFAWQPDQAEEIGRILKMDSLFAPSEQIGWFDRFGNGLLSRLDLTNVVRIPLPGTQRKRYRNATLTSILWNGQVVHLMAVHIDSTRDRSRQLEIVCELFLSLDEPALLMGDLNTREDDPTLQRLLATRGVVDALSAAKPTEDHIDWIIVRGLMPMHAEIRDVGASDHPCVRAELRLIQRPNVRLIQDHTHRAQSH
ncbi:MAG: endonuclease/exonuclease/phosphatase family protein [Planctomycetia bacterium]|nr:endonuclease/exonuclease/phosphatase family protein [Planctomycetia bacterium]